MSAVERIRERVESITGLTVRDARYVERLEETDARFGDYADQVEDFIDMVTDFTGSGTQEMPAERRRYLARQSRVAFIKDPLAGAEANHRANFALGRGIPIPQANEPRVQEIIDRAWKDPNNLRKLTSYEAQRHRSNDLLAGANLYPVLFEVNGRVRVGFQNEDLVTDIVTDPEDDETPLWYVVRKRETKWNFTQHRPDFVGPNMQNGTERVWYIEHWRNVEDTEAWCALTGETPPERPRSVDILPGKVEHFRINRIGRTQFGIPPWARTLRFYSAMNQLTEAQVQMRQAAATLVAKRVRRGGPRDLMKTASNLMKQTGQLAAARFGGTGSPPAAGLGTQPSQGGAPPPAGSWWLENESDKLEAVRLSSGSAEAAQDAQIVRAPISAASGFGPHYLGDPSSINMSGAVTLELPTLMDINAWQETLSSILRFFTDYVIECAVRTGQLGGLISEGESDGRPLNALHLKEDRAELEKRTGLDLSYTFDLPYPGRRNLPDVINAIVMMAGAFDPMGMNQGMRRALLDYAARHGLEIEDPARWVDEVMPEDGGAPGTGPAAANATALAQLGALLRQNPPGNGNGLARDPKETGAKSQYGEKRDTAHPERMAAALREQIGDPEFRDLLSKDVNDHFDLLLGSALAMLSGRPPAVNGRANGSAGTILP